MSLDFRNVPRRNTNRSHLPIRSTSGSTSVRQWYSSHASHLTKRQMTPGLINVYALKKVLEAYSGMNITKDLREAWSREMQEMETVRYLSMDHLAIALIMIHIYMYGSMAIEPSHFDQLQNPTMAQFLERLRLNSRNTDSSTIRKHKEVILSYIFAVLLFRQRNTVVPQTIVENIEDPDEPEVQPPNMQHVTGTENDYLPE
jgi:hypothetical protein